MNRKSRRSQWSSCDKFYYKLGIYVRIVPTSSRFVRNAGVCEIRGSDSDIVSSFRFSAMLRLCCCLNILDVSNGFRASIFRIRLPHLLEAEEEDMIA